MKFADLHLVRCECIPKQIENGKLYYSEKYSIAIHLCACGCGEHTVTPINPSYGWEISIVGDKPTISPSIGKFRMACKSHYFVRNGKVEWC